MKRSLRQLRKFGRLAVLAGALVLAIGAMAPASAGTDADLRAGYYFDSNAFALGGGLLTNLGSGGSWWFNPNLEVGFADNVNLITVNGDVHYDLPVESDLSWWLGAGPALMVTDPDGGESQTDFGVNVLGGLGLRSGSVRPYGQFKAIVADNTEVALMGGIRF